jgi:DNA-binding NarL/FixJ family response regulator
MPTVDPVTASAIRVLVADDHRLVRMALERLIAAEPGLVVAGSAADGLAVVALAARERPDVVLMDLNMPGLDGVTATRRIRDALPGTRVLMLSGQTHRPAVDAALAAGATGYLCKNVSAAVLLDAIRRTHAGEAMFSLHPG